MSKKRDERGFLITEEMLDELYPVNPFDQSFFAIWPKYQNKKPFTKADCDQMHREIEEHRKAAKDAEPAPIRESTTPPLKGKSMITKMDVARAAIRIPKTAVRLFGPRKGRIPGAYEGSIHSQNAVLSLLNDVRLVIQYIQDPSAFGVSPGFDRFDLRCRCTPGNITDELSKVTPHETVERELFQKYMEPHMSVIEKKVKDAIGKSLDTVFMVIAMSNHDHAVGDQMQRAVSVLVRNAMNDALKRVDAIFKEPFQL